MAILFVEETHHDRRLSPEQQPLKKSRLLRLVRRLRITFLQAVIQPIKGSIKLIIFISYRVHAYHRTAAVRREAENFGSQA